MTIATTSVRAPRTVTWMDTIYTINVERYQSGGIVGVFESTVPSRGGPPVHVHHNEDEVIHVIDGTYEFWLDGQITPVAAGASIFLPRGVPTSAACARLPPCQSSAASPDARPGRPTWTS